MNPEKPLNGKAYGSIPHLPGSKFGNREDKGIDEKAARFFLDKAGKNDLIIVLEKLDGSCVSVANVNGEIIPLIRSGYRAQTSHYEQHHLFHDWVMTHRSRFDRLRPGERICGEWLAQAHGTRYNLDGRDPFVAFDLFGKSGVRACYKNLKTYCAMYDLSYAPVVFQSDYYWGLDRGRGCSITTAMEVLGPRGYYGATDLTEGCVWRWERDDPTMPIMMAKYVRPESKPGRYLESETGGDPVWNWRPAP